MRITVRLLTRDYTSIHKSTTESKKRISWLKIFEKKTLIPDQYLDEMQRLRYRYKLGRMHVL